MTAEPLPAHRPRRLGTAEPEPAELWPTAYGLAVLVYRRLRCAQCHRDVDELPDGDDRCDLCLAAAGVAS